MSRLEWALRQCVTPKKIVRFMASDALRAKEMFDRAAGLIPRNLVKAYGLQRIIFHNESMIEFTTKDPHLLN